MSRPVAFLKRAAAFSHRWVNAYFESDRFEAPTIPHVSVETTNICNAKCVFCANPVMERRKQPLSMEHFEKFVGGFVAMGGTEIDFNATIGEPTLDPHLIERARLLHKIPHIQNIGFVTTLQWLHKHPLDAFFDCGITWLAVSCTLSGREKYLEFFGVDCYEQMLDNLITLLEENRRRGGPIHVGLSIKPTNEPTDSVLAHEDFRRVAKLVDFDLGESVDQQGFFVDDWQGAVELPEFLKLRPLYPRANWPCRMLYKGLNVYSNGNVGACQCRDYEANSELILGDVDDDLEELWNGDKLASIRQRWRENNEIPDICKSCRYYMR